MHETALHVLENLGIIFAYDEALDILEKGRLHGGQRDTESQVSERSGRKVHKIGAGVF